MWAFKRRLGVFITFGVLVFFVVVYIYMSFVYVAPTCFDGEQNGAERDVDCGGVCTRMCAIDVRAPEVVWVNFFRVRDGQYNAVAYIENKNFGAATPELRYKFILEDATGIIAEREGTTILPPDNTYPIFEGRIMTGPRVPTNIRIELTPPELWLPAERAREQFTVVDRGEIKNADAAPRLKSSLKNNALVPAENVEVVTTIYDVFGTPLTSSRTFADFAPQSVTDVTFTWPEPIAATLRSCEVPTDVILAIDLSGSMNNLGGVPAEPLHSVKRAAESFVNRLGVADRIGIVTFATDATLVVPLTPNPATVTTMISRLDIDPEEESGSTNSGAGLAIAAQELGTDRHNPDARKVVVLLTDGQTNAPDPEPELFALSMAAELQGAQTSLYTIGLGEEVNTEFLRNMASSPAHFFTSLSHTDIDSIYRQITESICEEGPATIDILPKSDTTLPEWP